MNRNLMVKSVSVLSVLAVGVLYSRMSGWESSSNVKYNYHNKQGQYEREGGEKS
jgi:hypothetical protein